MVCFSSSLSFLSRILKKFLKFQVRQKAEHKRTFFFLEQMILKNNANERCLKIKEEKDGLDFFFKSKPDAMKLLEFIQVNF